MFNLLFGIGVRASLTCLNIFTWDGPFGVGTGTLHPSAEASGWRYKTRVISLSCIVIHHHHHHHRQHYLAHTHHQHHHLIRHRHQYSHRQYLNNLAEAELSSGSYPRCPATSM